MHYIQNSGGATCITYLDEEATSSPDKTSNKVLLLDENVENRCEIMYSNDYFTQLCGYSATFVQELQVRCLCRVHELVDVVGR